MDNEKKVMPATENIESSENVVLETPNATEESCSVESNSEERRCPNCEALIIEEKPFCTECGTSLKSACAKCGTELQPGQLFCPECGNQITESNCDGNIAQYNKEIADKQRKKGKHKKLKIVLSIILAVLVVVGSYFGYIYHLRQQVLGYAIETEKYIEAINDTKSDLSAANEAWNIVNNGGSWLYYGTLKSYARSMFSTNISNAKTANSKIVDLYNDIKEFEMDDSYVDDIKAKAQEVQDVYLSVYDSVIVNESGYSSSSLSNLSSKISELQKIVENVKDAYGNANVKK